MAFRIGLDWGGAAHTLCVVDVQGAIAARSEVAHTAEGLTELNRRLARVGDPADLPVAIERPSGLVVEALLAAGHPVVPIHPDVVGASRSRYRAAAGKSDAGDAYLLADLLRTDGHRFRPLSPCSDEIKALRALVRGRDDLVATRIALANHLRSLLDGFWPGAAAIFAAVDSPIALAFLRGATPRPTAPPGSARSAWPASSASTTTAGAAPRPGCWPACAPPRPASPATPRPRPRARWCARRPPPSTRSSPGSPSSPAASGTP